MEELKKQEEDYKKMEAELEKKERVSNYMHTYCSYFAICYEVLSVMRALKSMGILDALL